MSRIRTFTVGLLIIVCVLTFVPSAQASVEVSDAELDCIIVGGPVSACSDCACPNCTNVGCSYAGSDPLGGDMCKDIDGMFGKEKCNCGGWFFESPYCHILTEVLCRQRHKYWKNPAASCTVLHPITGLPVSCTAAGHGSPISTTNEYSYDECTETDSDPHE
ncbi:MAG: hypothetical protein ACYS1A_11955 [Planctomycetota bacterium]|jgi:hypothetical protein